MTTRAKKTKAVPEEYPVEAVLNMRHTPTGREFLLKWHNWDGAPTWEPENLIDPSLVSEFLAARSNGDASRASTKSTNDAADTQRQGQEEAAEQSEPELDVQEIDSEDVSEAVVEESADDGSDDEPLIKSPTRKRGISADSPSKNKKSPKKGKTALKSPASAKAKSQSTNSRAKAAASKTASATKPSTKATARQGQSKSASKTTIPKKTAAAKVPTETSVASAEEEDGDGDASSAPTATAAATAVSKTGNKSGKGALKSTIAKSKDSSKKAGSEKGGMRPLSKSKGKTKSTDAERKEKAVAVAPSSIDIITLDDEDELDLVAQKLAKHKSVKPPPPPPAPTVGSSERPSSLTQTAGGRASSASSAAGATSISALSKPGRPGAAPATVSAPAAPASTTAPRSTLSDAAFAQQLTEVMVPPFTRSTVEFLSAHAEREARVLKVCEALSQPRVDALALAGLWKAGGYALLDKWLRIAKDRHRENVALKVIEVADRSVKPAVGLDSWDEADRQGFVAALNTVFSMSMGLAKAKVQYLLKKWKVSKEDAAVSAAQIKRDILKRQEQDARETARRLESTAEPSDIIVTDEVIRSPMRSAAGGIGKGSSYQNGTVNYDTSQGEGQGGEGHYHEQDYNDGNDGYTSDHTDDRNNSTANGAQVPPPTVSSATPLVSSSPTAQTRVAGSTAVPNRTIALDGKLYALSLIDEGKASVVGQQVNRDGVAPMDATPAYTTTVSASSGPPQTIAAGTTDRDRYSAAQGQGPAAGSQLETFLAGVVEKLGEQQQLQQQEPNAEKSGSHKRRRRRRGFASKSRSRSGSNSRSESSASSRSASRSRSRSGSQSLSQHIPHRRRKDSRKGKKHKRARRSHSGSVSRSERKRSKRKKTREAHKDLSRSLSGSRSRSRSRSGSRSGSRERKHRRTKTEKESRRDRKRRRRHSRKDKNSQKHKKRKHRRHEGRNGSVDRPASKDKERSKSSSQSRSRSRSGSKSSRPSSRHSSPSPSPSRSRSRSASKASAASGSVSRSGSTSRSGSGRGSASSPTRSSSRSPSRSQSRSRSRSYSQSPTKDATGDAKDATRKHKHNHKHSDKHRGKRKKKADDDAKSGSPARYMADRSRSRSASKSKSRSSRSRSRSRSRSQSQSSRASASASGRSSPSSPTSASNASPVPPSQPPRGVGIPTVASLSASAAPLSSTPAPSTSAPAAAPVRKPTFGYDALATVVHERQTLSNGSTSTAQTQNQNQDHWEFRPAGDYGLRDSVNLTEAERRERFEKRQNLHDKQNEQRRADAQANITDLKAEFPIVEEAVAQTFNRQINQRTYLEQRVQLLETYFSTPEFTSFQSGPGMFRQWYAHCKIRFKHNREMLIEGYGRHAKKTSAEANAADDILRNYDLQEIAKRFGGSSARRRDWQSRNIEQEYRGYLRPDEQRDLPANLEARSGPAPVFSRAAADG